MLAVRTGGSRKNTSECGICSIIRLPDMSTVIVGLDAFNTQNEGEIETLLKVCLL
jgi:hypothetical protein